MRKILIILSLLQTQLVFSQTEIENVWLTEYIGDSVTTEKFLVQTKYSYDNCRKQMSFDINGDTTELVTTFTDKFGNDSIETWWYGSVENSWTRHWDYNEKNQLIRKYTFRGEINNQDTTIFQYNSIGLLTKKTTLFERYHPFDSLIYQNGLLKEVVSYTPSEISTIEKYSYSKNENLKRIITYNCQGKKISKMSIKYNSDNKKYRTKILEYPPLQVKRRVVQTKEYLYSDNKILNKTNFVFHDRGYKYTSFYNDSGKKIKQVIKELDSNIIIIEEYE